MTKARNIAELANDISVDSNRDVTLSNLRSDQPMTFRNRIINGNLGRPINQRGAASLTTATGYTYDRWYYDGSTYLYQGIEDLNVNNGTYVISWVGSDITAEYLLSTDTTANNGWDGAGTFQTVANGGTFTVNESPEHGKHLWIRFSGTLSNLDKVMVEEGSVPTPFEHRPYGTELALCQRYYEKSYDISTAPGSATGTGTVQYGYANMPAANYVARFGAQFKVSKRSQPTIIVYDLAGNPGKCNYPDTIVNQSFTVLIRGHNNFSAETSSLSNNSDARIYFHYTAESEL